MKFCISILNEIVENRDGDINVNQETLEDLSDSLYKCTAVCQEAIDLLKKINRNNITQV